MEKAISLLLALLLFNIAASFENEENDNYDHSINLENLDDVDQEFGTRNKREAEELEPFEYIADYNGEFESSLRFKRDLAEQDPDDASIEDFEPRVRRDLKEEDDEIDEEAMEVRSKRESPLLVGDVLTMPGPKMQEWVENGTHRINQFTKLAYLLTNDIPAKIVYNLFQNATHRINLLNNEVHNIETTQYSSTSVVQMGYQIVKWFYAGMIKTDTFRDLKTPIMNAKYNSSIKYTAPNYTSLERNDTFFGYMNYKMPEWVFNGTHLVGSYSRLVHIINDPNSGLLVSNWFYNTSHQIDFVNDKVYAFAPSHYSPLNSAQQIVTWFIPSNGLIKQDTFKELEEPLADVNFNLSEIYFGSKNYTKIYKNESYARKREWSYDGTNLVNVNSRISYSVPSPVEAVLINNVFNNITHQTDFLMKKTYPVRNEMGGKFYQTISWYFNGLIRVDTLRNLQEPIIDPVFDLSTIYFEDPNSTYIYKNISKPPAIYMPPNLVPEWMFNGTHVNNLLKRIFYPIADPSAAEITSNWYYNATHKTDLLNRKSYSTDVKPSSTTPRVGYQVVNCRFKGVIRADTYKELYEPISEPTCNLKVIYNHPSKYTTFYADEKVSILPVKQPEWYFNGTHRINTFTNATYLVDNGKLQLPKEEWIFNGTHKVNLLTKESYPKEPERALPPVPEWIYNGTHKINTYTKKVYSMDPLPVQQPKDEWTFNGTHKVNLMTKEAYPTEPERSLPVQQEWIFNGTHKINTYTKKSYPVDSIASPPLPKDQWIYNGTHKVNLQTNEAYSSENQNSQPPKNEWVFNGTHKVNYATNIAYAVEPLPDAARPKTVDPLKDQWVASEKPAHSEEWIFNGTHKVNTKTNEAHVIPGYEKEREIVQPSLPPDFNEHPNVFTSNGTHKVNYHTKEAYPVEEVEVKPPQFVEDKREQEKTAHETKSAPEVQTPVGTKSFIPESPNKDLNSMHVKSPPMAPPSAPHPDKMPPRKDQLQNKDYVAPKLPETIKPVANKPPPAVPKIEATKTTKKPQQDIKVKLEPKFKCAGESFKDAEYCCKSNSMDEFFGKKELLSCNDNKPNAKLFAYANEYVLNKFQTLDNPIDFKSSYIAQQLQEPACFANCLFKKRVKSAFSSTTGRLNTDALGEFLNKKVKRGKSDFVTDQFNYCKEAAQNVSQEVPAGKCSLYSLVILQCLQRRLSTECSRPESSPECTAALQNLGKCDPLPSVLTIAKSAQKVKIAGRMNQQANNDEKKRRGAAKNKASIKKNKKQG